MSNTLLKPADIAVPGIPGFLLWAKRDNPRLYDALCRAFPEVAAWDNAAGEATGTVDGLMDALSSLGSKLASSAKKIAGFVTTNALPIATAALPLVVAKKQADIAKAQVKLAQVQSVPAPTATVPGTQYSGQPVVVPVANVANPAISPAPGIAQLKAPVMGIPLWGWLAAGGVLTLLLAARQK